MQETLVQFLGQEDPLEKEMATHSNNILAWRIPWTEEPGRLQSMRSQKVGHDLVTKSAPSLTMDWLHFPVVILIGTTSKKIFFYGERQGVSQPKNQIFSWITAEPLFQPRVCLTSKKTEVKLIWKIHLFQQLLTPTGKRVRIGLTLAKSGWAKSVHSIRILKSFLRETVGRSLSFSEPPFPYLPEGDNGVYLSGFWWQLTT